MTNLSSRFKTLARLDCDEDEKTNPVHEREYQRGIRFKVITRVKYCGSTSRLSCGNEDEYNLKGDLFVRFKCSRLLYKEPQPRSYATNRSVRDNIKLLLRNKRYSLTSSSNAKIDGPTVTLKSRGLPRSDSAIGVVRPTDRRWAAKSAYPRSKSAVALTHLQGGFPERFENVGDSNDFDSRGSIARNRAAAKSAMPRRASAVDVAHVGTSTDEERSPHPRPGDLLIPSSESTADSERERSKSLDRGIQRRVSPSAVPETVPYEANVAASSIPSLAESKENGKAGGLRSMFPYLFSPHGKEASGNFDEIYDAEKLSPRLGISGMKRLSNGRVKSEAKEAVGEDSIAVASLPSDAVRSRSSTGFADWERRAVSRAYSAEGSSSLTRTALRSQMCASTMPRIKRSSSAIAGSPSSASDSENFARPRPLTNLDVSFVGMPGSFVRTVSIIQSSGSSAAAVGATDGRMDRAVVSTGGSIAKDGSDAAEGGSVKRPFRVPRSPIGDPVSGKKPSSPPREKRQVYFDKKESPKKEHLDELRVDEKKASAEKLSRVSFELSPLKSARVVDHSSLGSRSAMPKIRRHPLS